MKNHRGNLGVIREILGIYGGNLGNVGETWGIPGTTKYALNFSGAPGHRGASWGFVALYGAHRVIRNSGAERGV